VSEPKGSRCAMSHRYSTKISSLEEAARRICENRGGKWSGTKGMACCPAHDDRTPSLGVSLGQKAILFHCFAGCDQQSVLAALVSEGVPASAWFSGGAIEPTMDTGPAAKPSAAALRIWRDAQPLGGEQRLELTGFSPDRLDWYKNKGCFTEIIRYRTRLFVPVSRAGQILPGIAIGH